MDKNLEELRFYLPMIERNFDAIKQQLKDLIIKVGEVKNENSLVKEQNIKISAELANIQQEIAILKAKSKANYIPIQ